MASIELVSPGAQTLRGIEIGDSIEDVEDLYPELECGSQNYWESTSSFPYCAGNPARGRWIWFGGDPVNLIVLSSSDFQ